MKWIDAAVKLPIDNTEVLIHYVDSEGVNSCDISYYENETWWGIRFIGQGQEVFESVTLWMPLPEMPVSGEVQIPR